MVRLLARQKRAILVCVLFCVFSACKSETESVSSTPASAVGEARSVLQSPFQTIQGRTSQLGPLEFGSIPKNISRADIYHVVLRVTFRETGKFPLNELALGLNGIQAWNRDFDLSRVSRWDEVGGRNELVIGIGKLLFEDSRGFHDKVKRIQSAFGNVRVWLKAPLVVRSAVLEYYEGREEPFPSRPAAAIVWDHLPPASSAARAVRFSFHPSEGRGLQECSLDNRPWRLCWRHAVYHGLSPGMHTFSARALSSRRVAGPASDYRFEVQNRAVEVAIDATLPSQTTTSQTSLQASFSGARVRGGGRPRYECRLDQQAPAPCVSPVTYDNLSDGPHQLVVKEATSAALATYEWIVDTRAPLVMWMETPASEDSRDSFTFELEVDEAAETQCSFDGNPSEACDSLFAVDLLADGVHELEVQAVDLAGNRSLPLRYSWKVDTTVPAVQLNATPAAAHTNSTVLDLDFQASEPSQFSCVLDGAPLETCASPLHLANLEEGGHELVVIATDGAGNVSEPALHAWEVDLTRPVLSIGPVFPQNFPTPSSEVTLQLVASESASLTCSFDAGVAAPCSGRWSVGGLSEGVHRLEVASVDEAGNTGETATFAWKVDRTAPRLTLISVWPSQKLTFHRSLSLDFRPSESAVISCELDGGGNFPCGSPYLANGLSEGKHTLSVRARDAAGNESAVLTHQWEVDATPPALAWGIKDPAALTTTLTRLSVAFDAPDAKTYTCAIDDAESVACTSPFSAEGFAEGAHSLAVVARDDAGNSSTLVHQWTVVVLPRVEISGVSVSRLTSNSATVSWRTNVPALSRVLYGESSPTDAITLPDATLRTTHSVLIKGLSAGTLYYAQALSADVAGFEARSSVVSFRLP